MVASLAALGSSIIVWFLGVFRVPTFKIIGYFSDS